MTLEKDIKKMLNNFGVAKVVDENDNLLIDNQEVNLTGSSEAKLSGYGDTIHPGDKVLISIADCVAKEAVRVIAIEKINQHYIRVLTETDNGDRGVTLIFANNRGGRRSFKVV